jgi:hypothetical protein
MVLEQGTLKKAPETGGLYWNQCWRIDPAECAAQSPKYGKSPLRAAIVAFVIRMQSITVSTRLKMVSEGAKGREAVLDHMCLVPLFGQ